ncbi:unnamed protein product [Fusarium graminearum]|nr:unnamed protein product [Fusarium graminearum]CAG1997399.1 unnamed protein product [Fusarium graminearum]
MMSDCDSRPAANAAEAVKTIWPPMLIQPVMKEAEEHIEEGAMAATQWYCPDSLVSSEHKVGENGNVPPAVGYIEAISPREAAVHIEKMADKILDDM